MLMVSAMMIRDSSSESDAMVGTSPLTQYYVHPGVSPPPVAKPNVTPALAPGQRDILGRVMIESNRSS
ncbi:hypothetical protein H5410_046657 [Solanum commersonii]|uniref:Uncharacterized protein n=1 Tax=Solanum commersonii TaxID=4109 RepID=A0A9J5XF16_SOLCO|nr:hypothetical protein H5410_046657 [Solanum commersonii]